MSIDARIESVRIDENGGGRLNLIDRPANPGATPGCAGQKCLKFEKAPEEVTALNGLDVWGDSSSIMLGDIEIAKRVCYTRIAFCETDRFKSAVRAYHCKRLADVGQ